MRSEGYGSCRVCLSVSQSVSLFHNHLTLRAINRSTNDTTYSASDKGRKVRGVFSETAAFGSYGVKHEHGLLVTILSISKEVSCITILPHTNK